MFTGVMCLWNCMYSLRDFNNIHKQLHETMGQQGWSHSVTPSCMCVAIGDEGQCSKRLSTSLEREASGLLVAPEWLEKKGRRRLKMKRDPFGGARILLKHDEQHVNIRLCIHTCAYIVNLMQTNCMYALFNLRSMPNPINQPSGKF